MARVPVEPRAARQVRSDWAVPGRLVDELVAPLQRFRVEAAAGLWGVAPLEAALALGLVSAEAIAAALSRRVGGMVTRLDGAMPVVAADPADWRPVLARGVVGIVHPVMGKAILMAPDPAEAERLAADGPRPSPGSLPVLVTTPQAFARLVRTWAEDAWYEATVPRLEREQPAMSAADRGLMRRMAGVVIIGLILLFAALVAGPAWLAALARRDCSRRVRLGLGHPAPDLGRHPAVAASAPPAAGRRTAALFDSLRTLPRGGGGRCAARRAPSARLSACPSRDQADPGGRRHRDARGRQGSAARSGRGGDPGSTCGGRAPKPKALAMALPFASGDLVVVYDAEDRPGAGQLKEAAETFAAGEARLGCLQAPLAIVNERYGWLARFFTAEYDALFRVLLPAFAGAGLPLPLGGTSNHFRRAALDQSLGWDPYNVTEDADLGFRLARFGWRTGTITTPTREEAPPTFRGWFGQRSRWFKGWLQTLAVLARDPARLAGELGARGLVALVATLAGSLGSALVHLVCLLALLATCLVRGLPSWAGPWAIVFALGYVGSIAYKTVGLARAGRLRLAPWLLLLPLAWIAMGLAALRAVVDLWRRPFHWEKTEHGVAQWPAVAAAPAADGDAPPEAIHRIVALSESAIASGRHQPRDVAAALRRHCDRMRAAGVPEGLVTALDGYRRHVESRAPTP